MREKVAGRQAFDVVVKRRRTRRDGETLRELLLPGALFQGVVLLVEPLFEFCLRFDNFKTIHIEFVSKSRSLRRPLRVLAPRGVAGCTAGSGSLEHSGLVLGQVAHWHCGTPPGLFPLLHRCSVARLASFRSSLLTPSHL